MSLHPSSYLHSILLFSIYFIFSVQAQQISHDEGLWGSLKASIAPFSQPIQHSLCTEYNKLSDRGRFVAGACFGFAASKLVVGGKHNVCDLTSIVADENIVDLINRSIIAGSEF